MEKERKFKTIGLIALIVAVVGLSIAFAALSRTLTINGTAKQTASSWQVVWEKLSGEDFVTAGTAEVQENYPTITNNGTNLNLGVITLKKPKDKVTYRVNMANNGTIDAKVTGVTGVSVNNTYVEYSVKYLDNNTNITQANGRLLAAGDKKLVLIEVKFKESVTTEEYNQIPSEGIEVILNGVSIEYTQDDGSAEADPEPEQEQLYNISVNDLANIDLAQYEYGEYPANLFYGFEDQSGVLHVFFINAESTENTYIMYYPDFSDTTHLYYYNDDSNLWDEWDMSSEGEGASNPRTGLTIGTDSLVFTNVRPLTASEYTAYGVSQFSPQLINDIFTLTEAE